MFRRRFLVNPGAGGVSSSFLKETRRYFLRHDGNFDSRNARNAADFLRAVEEACAQGVEQIVAVGGDGTVNAVANALLQQRGNVPSLAVAKAGTGSDYWRNILAQRPTRTKVDWKDVVREHEIREHDVGVLEWGANLEHARYFVNAATFGWSARVVQAKENLSSRVPRALSYLLPTALSLNKLQAETARLRIDGETIEHSLLALFVCKGLFAGSGLRFGEQGHLDDGAFDVLWLGNLAWYDVLKKFPQLFSSGVKADTQILRRRAQQIELLSPAGLATEIDGEFIADAARFRLRLEPRRLRVCVPRT
ncbi:MAG: NAD(+)/NADH kinase [Bdellovibrionales bacterium]|nr:NAD(+)/NADH kinase [Bdellovibrionales bacterium]